MTSRAAIVNPAVSGWRRMLNSPVMRIGTAIVFVGVPFAIISAPLNLLTDKSVKRLGALVLAAIALAGYSAYVRVIERRTVTELGRRGAALELGAGLLLGALLISITVSILAALGVYQVTGRNEWQVMLPVLAAAIVAGVLEELLIRGALFRILEYWLGSWLALALSAAIFGALHLFNPGATLFAGIAIAIEAGILLAAAYMLTQRLWLCIGMHIAWNFTQGGIYSVAVSGGGGKGLLQTRMAGSDWVTGGAFGAEASVVALIVCTAAGLILLALAVKKGHVIQPSWVRQQAVVSMP
jgi:uncharacterized protein